jgi:hypothetical protein
MEAEEWYSGLNPERTGDKSTPGTIERVTRLKAARMPRSNAKKIRAKRIARSADCARSVLGAAKIANTVSTTNTVNASFAHFGITDMMLELRVPRQGEERVFGKWADAGGTNKNGVHCCTPLSA